MTRNPKGRRSCCRRCDTIVVTRKKNNYNHDSPTIPASQPAQPSNTFSEGRKVSPIHVLLIEPEGSVKGCQRAGSARHSWPRLVIFCQHISRPSPSSTSAATNADLPSQPTSHGPSPAPQTTTTTYDRNTTGDDHNDHIIGNTCNTRQNAPHCTRETRNAIDDLWAVHKAAAPLLLPGGGYKQHAVAAAAAAAAVI